MARYIDVEALKNDGHPCWHDGEGNIYYEVDHAPTADVAEVKHGEWLYNRGQAPNEKAYFCSLCAEGESDYGTDRYCNCCGAKMDGGKADDK